MKRLLPLTLIFCFISALNIYSQGNTEEIEVFVQNPSFEDTPRKGLSINNPINSWTDCGSKNFPFETPPDIHPDNLWENTLPAADGKTYLGMAVRDNETWESVGQRLSSPLKTGQCYEFSVNLSQSGNYWSGSRLEIDSIIQQYGDRIPSSVKLTEHNFSQPTVLRVWAGNSLCNISELIAESTPINSPEWQTHTFKINPKDDYNYLILEAFYKTPVFTPYNGHILIDNFSSFKPIKCEKKINPVKEYIREVLEDEKEVLVINTPVPKINKNTKPSIKKNKPRPHTYNNGKKNITKKHHSFSNVDKSKLKKGQILNLEKLYFQADTSAIAVSSMQVLDDLYQFLKENDNIIVEVGGHTNSTPTTNYCDRLSTARAKVVTDYLISKGIRSYRVTYKGYGKRKPIASNKSKEGRKKNQRVEIKIIKIT